MWSGKKRILLAILMTISLFALSSCTKKNDSTSNKDDNAKNDREAISDSNFRETNEDLLNVDYKQFYDELAPHGDWVQVSAKDLGIDLNQGVSAGKRNSLFKDLIGIKDAYADDIDVSMFFVWRPSPDLAVAVSTGGPAAYVPYYNGQWINTDAGWYFMAPTPYEEITVHYGRWFYDPVMGWVWVPGRVWAPAWVEWYGDDDYIGWAPLPPTAYIIDDGVPPVVINNDQFIFVQRNYFVDPVLYSHCYFYRDNPDRFQIKQMTRVDGVMVNNNVVINRGPDVAGLEKITGKKIDPVKVNRVDNIRKTKYSGGEVNSYSPHFTRVNGSDRKESVTKPNNFISYDHAQSKSKNDNSAFNHPERKAGSNQSNDNKASRENNKERLKGSNKQNNDQMTKGNRKNDYKQKDSYNGNQEKFRRKTKDNSGNYKQNQDRPKGNDKGQQKQYRPKGNDNGQQKQNKSNGRQNSGPTQRNNNSHGSDNQSHGNDRQSGNYGNGNDRGSNQTQGNGHGRGKH